MQAKKRLTLELSADVHDRLRTMATLKGETVEQFCFSAILDALSRDEPNGVKQRMTLGEWADDLKARQKELYGDRVLSDSAEDLRQAREIRNAQMDRW